MKWMPLAMMISSAALVAGCVGENPVSLPPANEYCVVVNPIFFDDEKSVDWLAENDPDLLRSIVSHNEQMERLCP